MKLVTFYDHAAELAAQQGISTVQALQTIRALGIEAVEVSSSNFRDRKQELKAELDAAGLQVSSICAYLDFVHGEDQEEAIRTLDAAQYLGAAYVLVIPGFHGKDDTPEMRERQVRTMLAAMEKFRQMAVRRDICLMIEDYDDALSPVATIAGMQRVFQNVPGVGCAFDTGNFLFSEEDERQAFEELKDFIVYVHLKDRRLTVPDAPRKAKQTVKGREMFPSPLGQGVIRMGEIIQALQKSDYDGVYTIEHYGAPDQLLYLTQSVRWLKEQLGREDVL